MSVNKIVTNYVSEIDQFLQGFDKQHSEPSKSQQKEITKYQRIYRLRDNVHSIKSAKKLWDDFSE